MLARYESDGFGIEALIDRASGAHDRLGRVWRCRTSCPRSCRRSRSGWRLSQRSRGKGLATEAGAAAVDFGFTKGGLDRIVSIYEPENVASGRVMERLGFTHCVHDRGAAGRGGRGHGAAREQWEERRAVGDIAVQTATERVGEGRHTADGARRLGDLGTVRGYVAAIALRAAGAESPLVRPASFFCHYLSVAAFAPVDLVVTPLRSGRTVLAQRVEMTQQGRPVLDAMVWSVGDVAGLEHEDIAPPDVPGPDELPNAGPRSWPDEDSRPRFSRSGTTSTRG